MAPDVTPPRDGLNNLMDWICGCIMIYGALFGLGKILLHEYPAGFAMLATALAAGAVIYWDLNRRGWKTIVD